MDITTLGTPVSFTAVELGAYALPVGALNTLDTTVYGWDSIGNLIEGTTGRFVESDEELRVRHAASVRATGAATVKAIRARMLAEVQSIAYCAVYENRTNAIDEFNMPPHSVEVVVSGGTDQDVASKLYEVKPAGIETYGNTDIVVYDDNGDGQIVNFSRPTDKLAWIRVSVNVLNSEEVLTTEVVQAIKDAVIAYSANINVGNDIITQRFYGPIYAATSGIGSITVDAAITDTVGGTPSYSTNNISLGRAELALFDESRVSVVGV